MPIGSAVKELQSHQVRINDLARILHLLQYLKEKKLSLDVEPLEHTKIIAIVLEIARVCEALSRDDKNKQLIRNKFGKYDWSNNKKLNEHGIDFNFLARFKLFLDDGSIVQEKANTILTGISPLLKDEITILYDKFLFILKHQITDLEKNPTINELQDPLTHLTLADIKTAATQLSKRSTDNFEENKILHLNQVAEIVYAELLFTNAIFDIDHVVLNSENNQLTREGRYAFGRMLSILGETYKDLPACFKPPQLQTVFKIISDLRDKIAHGHKKYVFEPSAEFLATLTVEKVQDYLASTKAALNILLQYTQSVNTYAGIQALPQLEFSPADITCFETLLAKTTQLEESYKKPPKTTSSTVQPSAQVNTPPAATSKKVYSSEEAQIRKITGIIKRRQVSQETLAILQRKDNEEEQNTLLTKHYKGKSAKLVIPQLIKDIKINLEKEAHEKQVYEKLTGTAFDENLFEKTQQEMQETRQIPVKKVKAKTTRALLAEMQSESDYLKTLFHRDPLNIYAIEYAVTAIGEIGHNLAQQKDERVTELVPPAFIGSLSTTITTRNKKMHELINALKIPLREVILRDTLPMQPELKALRDILVIQEEKVPMDIGALFTLSFAYIELNQFSKAIATFNEILLLCQQSYANPNVVMNVYIGLATIYGLQGDEHLRKENIPAANSCFRLKCNCLTHVLALHQVIEAEPQSAEVLQIKALFDPSIDRCDIDVSVLPTTILTAGMLNNCGVTFGKLKQHDTQVAYLTKAVQIAHQLNDTEREAKYLGNLSNYYMEMASLEIENFYVDQVYPTIPMNQMLNCAIGCLWQTRRLLMSLAQTPPLVYVNISLKLCHALQLTELPYFFLLTRRILAELKTTLDTLPGRKTDYEFEEFARLEKTNKNKIQSMLAALSKDSPVRPHVEEDLTELFGNDDEQDIFLLQVATQGLGSVYGSIGVIHELTTELQKIKTAHQQMPVNSESDAMIRDIHVLQDEGVVAFIVRQYSQAIGKFLAILDLCKSKILPPELSLNFRKRAYTDLARSYRDYGDAKNATTYFLCHIELIGTAVNLDADGLDCLIEGYKLNQQSPAALVGLYEKIDSQYQSMESSLSRYDVFLICLAGIFLRTLQFDKALAVTNRVINILRTRNFPGDSEKKTSALLLLARVQIEYYEHITCLQQSPYPQQYEFYRTMKSTLVTTASWDDAAQHYLQSPLELSEQMITLLPKIISGEETGHFASANQSYIRPSNQPSLLTKTQTSTTPPRAMTKYYIADVTPQITTLLASLPCHIVERSSTNGAWIEIDSCHLKRELREQLSLFRVRIKDADEPLRNSIKTLLPFATIENESNAIIVTGEESTKLQLKQLVDQWEKESLNLSCFDGLKGGFLNKPLF